MPRAMTSDAKQEKQAYIISHAFKLYQQKSFYDFRMQDLADACHMSKGILFKYFRTKEILFFHMLDIEYTAMMHALEQEFLQYDVISPYQIKKSLIYLTEQLFTPDTNLVRLSRIKNIILEQNIDYEFAEKHKLTLTALSQSIFGKITPKLQGITADQFSKIFSVHTALLYGYLNSCTTSPIMKKVIDNHHLSQYEIDPVQETIETLSIFIDGYIQNHNKGE